MTRSTHSPPRLLCSAGHHTDASPTVSIVMPIYNREAFLPLAIDAIVSQRFTDWELIIVDDGSVDHSKAALEELCRSIPQPVWYVYQENRGAYAARNAGIALARGKYIAMFDSDDQWLNHHLADCVTALSINPDVDWVYGAARRFEYATGQVLDDHSFYIDDQPRPLLQLHTRRNGALHIIEDDRVTQTQILHGLYCGLQVSVIRRSVFEAMQFNTHAANSEDQVFVVRYLATGRKIAYFNKVHLNYQAHEQSTSNSVNDAWPNRLRVHEQLLDDYRRMLAEVPLNAAEQNATRQRISEILFWRIGYGHLEAGEYRLAMEAFRQGMKYHPGHLPYWKTYLIHRLLPWKSRATTKAA